MTNTPEIRRRQGASRASLAAGALALGIAVGVGLGGAASTATAAPASKTCTSQHVAAGWTYAEARDRCAGDNSPRAVIQKKYTPPPYTSQQPRNWWDRLPAWTHGLLIFGGLGLVALAVGAGRVILSGVREGLAEHREQERAAAEEAEQQRAAEEEAERQRQAALDAEYARQAAEEAARAQAEAPVYDYPAAEPTSTPRTGGTSPRDAFDDLL
ncbi:hypothetical protein ABQE48_13085 [Mycolicibacterium thermoresistibile]